MALETQHSWNLDYKPGLRLDLGCSLLIKSILLDLIKGKVRCKTNYTQYFPLRPNVVDQTTHIWYPKVASLTLDNV